MDQDCDPDISHLTALLRLRVSEKTNWLPPQFQRHPKLLSEAHVHPRCIARPVLKKKTFSVVENRCLQCVESILLNLLQFVKFGFKKSLNRCFWYFSLHLSGYFGLVSSLFVSVSVCLWGGGGGTGGSQSPASRTFLSLCFPTPAFYCVSPVIM